MRFGFNFFKGRKEKEYFLPPIGLDTKNGRATHDNIVIRIINETYNNFLANIKDSKKKKKYNFTKRKHRKRHRKKTHR
jgi:hypothetical protein